MKLGNPIASGNTASIYLHDQKVIKVFNEHFPEGEAQYEANKQKLARSCGLPVPNIFEVTFIDGKQAIIMEYVEGKTFGDIVEDEKEKAASYMNRSIDIQIGIHTKKASELEPMNVKLRRQLESAKGLTKRQKHSLLEKLDGMIYEDRLCHGDFHLYNLIESANGSVIIDWTDSSRGDIRADVYRTYLLYSGVSMEMAELYMRLYCEKSGLSREEVLEWAPIIAGARMSENVPTENQDRLLEIVHHYCPT
ncbi:aminoglycoside phosphotransferase family protein [Rossellomorea aquimaris]|uniref:phosphotransferase family protein n=1 Tax=Rossellomorea aquimaris TaxID=189382 RepID=UPI001CD4BC25|nr:aminoglycoside phosphotransferase family protein [Rossellomorea aquimaris]MCA1055804.1 aminoglycoside phosphotransferase family protein [Rossellomorea aquimaris]